MAILLFDWGGSSVKYGVWDNGSLVQKSAFKTPADWPAMQAAMMAIYHQYRQDFTLEGVSISAPGNVDPERGVIGGLSAIPYIHHFCIVDELRALFKLPVCIENDANAAAIAEAAIGAGQRDETVLFVIVGSGVGGAVVRNKTLHRGAHKYAGEFGLMTLHDGKTFSELGTAVAMARRYCERKALIADSLNGSDIFRLAEEGDILAQEEVASFYHWMATGLLNLQVCYDPDCIIIGGGISSNDAVIAGIQQQLRESVAEKGLSEFLPRVVACQYRNDANLIGAAVHFTRAI